MTENNQPWAGKVAVVSPDYNSDAAPLSTWQTAPALRRLLGSAPVAIVTTDSAGRILYANARTEEMFGYDSDELQGKSIELLIPERYRGIHVEHRERYMERPHVRSMGTGMDLAGRRKNGVEFPIETGLSFIQTADDMVIISSITDISRRKETEEMLEMRVRQRTRELERRREVSDGLRDTLAILNSNRSQAEILDHIVIQASRLLCADACAIYSLDKKGRKLTRKASFGLTSEDGDPQLLGPDFVQITDEPDPENTDSTSLVAGKRMHIVTVERPRDESEPDLLQATSYRALLSVPLVVKEAIYGNLMLYFTEPRKFSPEEIELATAVGDQAALAIENARLRTQVERAAVTAERNRIARDLHDSVTQTLFSATLIAEVLPRVARTSQDESERLLQELRQLTRGALAEMRTLLLELRPATLGEVDINELLRQLTEGVTGRARMPIALTIEGDSQLSPDVKVAFYHIAQEALNNVAKHARASQAEVHLEGDQHLATLTISDNGRGFVLEEVTPEHLGITIMRERAQDIDATLEIKSRTLAGTEVVVTWTRRPEK